METISWIPPNQASVMNANQSVPVILNLDGTSTTITASSIETSNVETQTMPWDGILRLSIQEYLSRKLEPLLLGRIRGNMCIHKKGMTLEDVLAIIVERHMALCVCDQDEIIRQVQTPSAEVDQFTEAEAAAVVMTKLLDSQNQQGNPQPGTSTDIPSSNPARSSHKKAVKRPAENTMEELMRRNIKVIRCDPPKRVLEREAEILKSSSINQRRHIPAKKWFQCAECGLKLEDISKLYRHSAKHSTLRPYSCPKCHKTFKTRDAVGKHFREVHARQTLKIFCSYCGKGFRTRSGRDEHVLSHTGERPWKCSHCSKSFKVRKSLILHSKTRHNIGEMVECPLCNCSLPTLHFLGNHLASIHKAQVPQALKNIFIYKCLVCNGVFSEERSLLQHMPTHGKPECKTCTVKERRRQRLMEEAVARGMDPDEAATQTVQEIVKWITEAKEKAAAKRLERESVQITTMAIANGMDEEAAKDVTKAREFMKKKREQQMKKKGVGIDTGGAIVKSPSVNITNMSLEELRKIQLESLEKEQKLNAEIADLKEHLNKDAMVLAMEIVEEIEAEEVIGKSCSTKEMALVRAQLAARNKEGKSQKSLVTFTGKRTVGLQTDRKCDVAGKIANVAEAIESQAVDPVIRFHENKAYLDRNRPVMDSLDRRKLVGKNTSRSIIKPVPAVKGRKKIGVNQSKLSQIQQENVKKAMSGLSPHGQKDSKQSTNEQASVVKAMSDGSPSGQGVSEQSKGQDNVKKATTDNPSSEGVSQGQSCIVYSRSPATTLDMLKKGEVTFCVVRNNTTGTMASHMPLDPSSPSSGFSKKIIIRTGTPEAVKEKLMKGELNIKIVPIVLREENISKMSKFGGKGKRVQKKILLPLKEKAVTRSMTGSSKPKKLDFKLHTPSSKLKLCSRKQSPKADKMSKDKGPQTRQSKKDGRHSDLTQRKTNHAPLPSSPSSLPQAPDSSKQLPRAKILIVVPASGQSKQKRTSDEISKSIELPTKQPKKDIESSNLVQRKTSHPPPQSSATSPSQSSAAATTPPPQISAAATPPPQSLAAPPPQSSTAAPPPPLQSSAATATPPQSSAVAAAPPQSLAAAPPQSLATASPQSLAAAPPPQSSASSPPPQSPAAPSPTQNSPPQSPAAPLPPQSSPPQSSASSSPTQSPAAPSPTQSSVSSPPPLQGSPAAPPPPLQSSTASPSPPQS